MQGAGNRLTGRLFENWFDMEALNKSDIMWLRVIEYFALNAEEVILARYLLVLVKPNDQYSRVFTEHFLVETTGWSEYIIRRALGNWQTMGMARALKESRRTICKCKTRYVRGRVNLNLLVKSEPMNKTRIERISQRWEFNTVSFEESLNERVARIRTSVDYSRFSCGCITCDETTLFPSSDGVLQCQICGHEAKSRQLQDFTQYDIYVMMNDKSVDLEDVWQMPFNPQGQGESDEDIWEY